MSKYEFVFLDADETLFDFKRAERHALSRACGEFGVEASEELARTYDRINSGLWALLERGELDSRTLKVRRFGLLFRELDLEVDAESFSRAYIEWLSKANFLLPGAEELCAYLYGKYTLAIVTNGFREVQLPRIRSSAIQGYISAVVVSEEVGCGKPDRAIFEYASALVGARDKGRMIMVGDSLSSDIQGGINFGIDTCWLNASGKSNDSSIRPRYEVRSLEGVKGIL